MAYKDKSEDTEQGLLMNLHVLFSFFGFISRSKSTAVIQTFLYVVYYNARML